MLQPKPTTNSMLPAPKLPWSIAVALLVVVGIYLGSQIAGQIIVSSYAFIHGWTAARTEDWLTNSTFAQFAYIVIVEALTIGLLYLFIRRRKVSFQMLGLRRPRFSDLGTALLSVPVYFIGYLLLLTVLKGIFPSINEDQQQQIGFNTTQTSIGLVLTFISLAVLPPLAEEIMVRGFLFDSLKKGLSVATAAVITSLIFASAHLQFGSGEPLLWIAAIDTFTLSLVLCYMKQKTGSLWAGIFLHALKNSVAFASIFIFHLS